MDNLFESIKESLVFNKFALDELVCVEYTCGVVDEEVGVYTQSDYIIYVLSGKKTWRTIENEWLMEAGQTIYVKKGAAIVRQFFEDDFCMFGFFLPDDIIREALKDVIHNIPINNQINIHQFTATKLLPKDYINDFIKSMYPYFKDRKEPPEAILRLKLKELLINILYNCENDLLVSYLKSVTINPEPSLTHIMETNFTFNLRLEEFAKMCHRSLSKFKRDFFNHYNTTPGKWLSNKRLEHAAGLLLNSNSNITQVAFDCGFEDVSHFSRAFKEKFGMSPSNYCKSLN
ncbi:helix-turn-helix domain-containing protein [Aestuariivivens insulae]|uniref:helix-turn-helix domain-containing protein n=1 Tax=Aestuariivivens insulae TaxID=1621988 RepID=UPI001F568056|nr:AraC family transcriptional regulator [Aestuariivivens insulae]